MAKSKIVEVNEKIAKNVVGGYKKIEDGAVSCFNKIADKFVDSFLTKEGESVEEARERLAAEQKGREAASKTEWEKRLAHQNNIVEENMKKAQNTVEEVRRKAGIE